MSFPIFTRSFASRPFLTTATALSVMGSVYYISQPQRRPQMLDSAQNEPLKTLQFPRNMLFSKELKVVSTEQVNHDTKRIRFELPGGEGEVSGVTPGGAVLTQHTPPGSFFPVLRPYTPIHDLNSPGILELLVKKYPNGRASSHMHSLQPGQTLTVRGPLPGASWKPSTTQPRDILLVAGGAGITPIYSLTRGILADEADKTRIQLVWGVNGTRDMVLKDELDKLERENPERLRVVYAVSGPEGKADAPGLGGDDGERFRKGYVDQTILGEAIERCKRNGGGDKWGDEKGMKVYLCGPPSMEKAVQSALSGLGVSKKELHKF